MPGRRSVSSPGDVLSDDSSDMDNDNPQSDAAATGSVPGAPDIHAQEVEARMRRIKFLAVALLGTFVTSAVGVITYNITNSLTIEVDFVCALTDVVSLGLNILVEFAKGRVTSPNTILVLDFGGGLTSLILLIGVAVFGVVNAQIRSHEEYSPRFHLHHINLMLGYNLFSLVMDMCTLALWMRWKDQMATNYQKNPDRLNVISGFIHTLVDFLRNSCVTLTTLWMLYIVHTEKNKRLEFKEEVHGDVLGSFLVCSCVLVSSGFLLRESLNTLSKIWERLNKTKAEEKKELKDSQKADSQAASKTYGTV